MKCLRGCMTAWVMSALLLPLVHADGWTEAKASLSANFREVQLWSHLLTLPDPEGQLAALKPLVSDLGALQAQNMTMAQAASKTAPLPTTCKQYASLTMRVR